MPRDLFHVLRFVDGEFDDLRSFEDRGEAASYSRGFVSGAGAHGMPRTFVIPGEEADLEAYERTGVSILPALAALETARCST